MMKLLIKLFRILIWLPYQIYRFVFGYPQEPVIGKAETIKMLTAHDCETVAIMNATGGYIKYYEVEDALLRIPCLGPLQDPLFGNPWNVKIALETLGYNVENIEPKDIKIEDEVIILLHGAEINESFTSHVFHQHWVAHSRFTPVNEWHFGCSSKVTMSLEDITKRWSCNLYPSCFRITLKYGGTQDDSIS